MLAFYPLADRHCQGGGVSDSCGSFQADYGKRYGGAFWNQREQFQMVCQGNFRGQLSFLLSEKADGKGSGAS